VAAYRNRRRRRRVWNERWRAVQRAWANPERIAPTDAGSIPSRVGKNLAVSSLTAVVKLGAKRMLASHEAGGG
jgi:hypothetical protein